MKRAFTAVIATVIIVGILLAGFLILKQDSPKKSPDAYVGIEYTGDSVEDGKALIDKVKGYTNLFVLASGLLQRDFESVNELGDYAVDAGMYFLPYFGNYIQATFSSWLESAKERWGDHFLGVYYSDEPGGKMLDDYVQFEDISTGDSITKTRYGDVFVEKENGVQINYEFEGSVRLYEPSRDGEFNYEAIFYPNGTITVVNAAPNGFSYDSYEELQSVRPFKDFDDTYERFVDRTKSNIEYLKNNTRVFTSDYDLQWFDYLSGYDVVLAQIGWNLTFNQQIAQIRGAAQLQNKEWGITITWNNQSPPYLANGTEILSQMKSAYECGAQYLVVFDYYTNDSSAYGTMLDEHFEALQKFWNDVVTNPDEAKGSSQADSAIVFPHNYGWGARWMEDKIWGIFKADDRTKQMWTIMQVALQEHGLNLDIVYADSNYPLPSKYQNIYNCSNLE